jgi:hypothetical protein
MWRDPGDKPYHVQTYWVCSTSAKQRFMCAIGAPTPHIQCILRRINNLECQAFSHFYKIWNPEKK